MLNISGTMGLAIISGILNSVHEIHKGSDDGTTPQTEEVPAKLPTRYIATVGTQKSADKLFPQFDRAPINVSVQAGGNVQATRRADVVLLACKPYRVAEVLQEKGMKEALAGKTLISICAGVTEEQLSEFLYPTQITNGQTADKERCRIVRAMPNTASKVGESMTVVATSTPPLPAETDALITWMFNRIGRVVRLPPHLMDVSTALCGSGPAFMSLILEAMADGAVAMGLPRAEAQLMAAQTMRGATGLVLGGEHPAVVRDKISTPGGCTMGGLLVLEEGAVRGTVAKAVRQATMVASKLGSGTKNVNGPLC